MTHVDLDSCRQTRTTQDRGTLARDKRLLRAATTRSEREGNTLRAAALALVMWATRGARPRDQHGPVCPSSSGRLPIGEIGFTGRRKNMDRPRLATRSFS
jgi:hypothetical protein